MVHIFLVTSVMSIWRIEVVFVCYIYTLYFLHFIAFFHDAVCSKKNGYVSVVCVCVCLCTYAGSFITMPVLVALSHRKPSTSVTSCNSCIVQDIDKRDTLFACEIHSAISKLRTQFKPPVGWVATSGGYLGARFYWQTTPGHGHNRRVGSFLEHMILCAAASATLLVNGGVEQTPGPGMEGESIFQILYSESDRILKSGTRCETCGRWYHNCCGNVKAQVAESWKWNWDRCGSERLRLLAEKLQNAVLQIDNLKRKNKAWKNGYNWRQLKRKMASGTRHR